MIVKIERIVPDGYGIGFANGLTIFVPLTTPGDVIKARIERQKGKIAFASLIEILEPAVDRIAPPCPYFGRCGGCDFQQMNYAAQLRAKVAILKDALRRLGKIDWPEEIKIVPSPAEWNYRTRVQWKDDGNGRFGYFERNSHQVIDIETCPILARPLQQELSRQRQNLKRSKQIEVQAVSADEQISIRLGRESEIFDENFYAANREASEMERQMPADKSGTKEICAKVGDLNYVFSAATFFQINQTLLSAFLKTVLSQSSGNFALDLYCGVGLFSLPLAARFGKVIGVEGNRSSIKFACKNAESACLTNAQFENAFVGAWLTANLQLLEAPDFVLLDPPRTGAERETIENLISLKPREIVYVSCNPATLARDLRILLESQRYRIERITCFDFFPQTHHVETIVKLRLITS